MSHLLGVHRKGWKAVEGGKRWTELATGLDFIPRVEGIVKGSAWDPPMVSKSCCQFPNRLLSIKEISQLAGLLEEFATAPRCLSVHDLRNLLKHCFLVIVFNSVL